MGISTVLKLRKLSVQKSMIRERTLRIQWWQDGVTQSMEMATTLKHGLLLRPKPWLGHIFVPFWGLSVCSENLSQIYDRIGFVCDRDPESDGESTLWDACPQQCNALWAMSEALTGQAGPYFLP